LDRLLMGKSFGASALGMYRQAQQLVMTPVDHINIPIYSVASPSLSILQGDSDRYRRYYQRIVLVIGLVTMPVGLYIAIFAEEITHVLLGPQWIAATVFLKIFGLVAFLRPVLDTSTVVMLTYGLSKRMLTLSMVYYAFAAACMFAGVFWGSVGVALSSVVTVVVSIFPRLYFSFRRTPVTVGAFFSAVKTPAIASLVMAGGLLFFRGFISHYGNAVSLFTSLGLAAILYAGMLFLLPGGRREIIALLLALITSLQGRQHPEVALEEANNPGAV
jgi:polysaccharide transporter, PST family